MSDSSKNNPPVVLMIRDGWGRNPHPEHDHFNAIHLAQTPVADKLASQWPATLIRTCGADVGLPANTMGNSEVGHQNIGAGRVVDQEIMRIIRSIRDESFFENPALRGAFEHAQNQGKNLHLMGLVSDGKVHSDLEHILALIEMAARLEFPSDRLFIHAFTDGRDTGPKTGLSFIHQVEQKLHSTGIGRIATVTGRYFSMDRDNRWRRIALSYACLTGRKVGHPRLNESELHLCKVHSASEAVEQYYANPIEPSREGDEFILPSQIVDENDMPIGLIDDGDAVIFFNFRGDRPREITKAFLLDDDAWAQVPNGGFERGKPPKNLYFCTMSGYEQGLPVSAIAFVKPPKMPGILGEVVSAAGRSQFHCAETEKFPHVTFFFNDYREEPFEGENRLLVPSPREVTTYDQMPEMSAAGVCQGVLDRLNADDCEDLIVVNFANPDMVGHTGKLDATIKAVQVIDECVGRVVEVTLARGGSLVITADHGNAEQMWNPQHDCPHTAHTTYDVPLYVVSESFKGAKLRSGGRLADIAPTVLELMGLTPPEAMTGRSLLADGES